MADASSLKITDTLEIPLAELHFQFSRSSGPGGQNVNRSATQVELTFDVANAADRLGLASSLVAPETDRAARGRATA